MVRESGQVGGKRKETSWEPTEGLEAAVLFFEAASGPSLQSPHPAAGVEDLFAGDSCYSSSGLPLQAMRRGKRRKGLLRSKSGLLCS